jgi:signal transduction histidine kinase
LLTGDEPYLAPYRNAVAKLPTTLAALDRGIAHDDAERGAFDTLSDLIGQKLAELDDTIAKAKAGRRDDALAIVRTDKGRELMDQARAIFVTMIAAADTKISEDLDAQRDAISLLRWVTIAGALAIAGVGAVIAWVVVAYTRQLAETQREIQTLNVSLEERVKERTTDLARANDEIQRFAYIETHDLRAPLVNIMGFTSEMETSLGAIRDFIDNAEGETASAIPQDARTAAFEDFPEAIGFIRSSTRKMDGLINAILKLSREGRRAPAHRGRQRAAPGRRCGRRYRDRGASLLDGRRSPVAGANLRQSFRQCGEIPSER